MRCETRKFVLLSAAAAALAAGASAVAAPAKPNYDESKVPPYSTKLVGKSLGYVRRGGKHGFSAHDWLWMLDQEKIWRGDDSQFEVTGLKIE